MAAAMVVILLAVAPSQAQQAPAYTDFQEAVTAAEQQGKNLALYFYADAWQTPQSLDDLLPKDWAVQTYLDRHYIRVNIDAESDAGRELAARYAPLGVFPTLALITPEGTLKGSLSTPDTDPGTYATFFLRTELLSSPSNLFR